MANFNKKAWENYTQLYPKSYTCWNCGNLVSSSSGYKSDDNENHIYICPHCQAPLIVDYSDKRYPHTIQGKSIKKLPKDVAHCYDEARLALSVGAYTAAVMMFRKILMNLAVDEGAEEGDSFSNYVAYLCDNGFVHKKQHLQANSLKRLGNDANHKIESRTEDEAKEMLKFVELLLLNNYEYADEVDKAKRVK